MTSLLSRLPLSDQTAPADAEELARTVRQAYQDATAIYPIGGGTSLDFGLPPRQPGLGLSLEKLDRVVDYPARDMTITAEAGIPLAKLAEALSRHGQRLPIDVPGAEQATLGGVMATDFSGPRRYGWGTMRDYVIGVSAVEGTGTPFKAGGRVVKNVAGYDLCKLLTGSLGALAVITQVTLKVLPSPESSAFGYCDLPDIDAAEQRLAALVNSQVTPAAVELLAGPIWREDPAFKELDDNAVGRLVVGFEGAEADVSWMQRQLAEEWRNQNVFAERVEPGHVEELWRRLTEFPACPGSLVVKASVLPDAVARFVGLSRQIDGNVSIQAHAGNGIVIARFGDLPPESASKTLITQLQPAAAEGSVVVLSYPEGMELTQQSIWGGAADSAAVMRAVKEKFDPKGLLNPGRFVF